MAPKFPNPDPATDSVRDRLNQFIEVAGRAVYPPLAVAPSPTTAGQIWWDISDTVKIRDEANAIWASLTTTMGAVSFKEAQTLTSGEKTQALSNIGGQPAGSYQPAGGYVRYDDSQTLTSPQQAQARANIGAPLSPTTDYIGGQINEGALVLPAGGTWAWECDTVKVSDGAWGAPRVVGVSAGGTTIKNADANYVYMYTIWKVA